MMQKSGLTVRQHEREGIAVPMEFMVCNEHSNQVHFSPGSSAMTAHGIRGKAADISSGGMGLECRQYVPRSCEGIVRVFVPDPIAVTADGSPLYECAFEHRVKVRRVYLIGREPLYAMGVAFVKPPPDIDARINALLKRVQSLQHQHSPARPVGKGAAHA